MTRKGFSLIELSIVIVLVGLLVAGVATGQRLKKEADMRRLVQDVERVQVALNSFYATYDQLPGDFNNATRFWSSSANGDGDGQISYLNNSAGAGVSEAGRLFEHLSLAGLYEGNFNPGAVLAANTGSSTDMLPRTIREGYILVTNLTDKGSATFVGNNQIGGNSVNVIRIGTNTTTLPHINSHVGSHILTVDEAALLDKKIDDGLARGGKFTGHNDYIYLGWIAERCLQFSSGVTHDPNLDRGGAFYSTGTSNVCNVSFDTQF